MNLNLSELARSISSENDVDVDRSGSSLAVIEFLREKKHIAELIPARPLKRAKDIEYPGSGKFGDPLLD